MLRRCELKCLAARFRPRINPLGPRMSTGSITHAVAQMHQDTQAHAASLHAHALLRYQLYALLTRLRMAHEQKSAQSVPPGRALQRFKAFELLVEKHFATWHQLPRYAQQLGCSEKSLVRASLEAAGVTPKVFISARIVLEAKRLLAHTTWPVARIAESLGYSDLANFAKFFKREAGCTPTEFRSRQTANQQGMAERLQATGWGAEGDVTATRRPDPVPE